MSLDWKHLTSQVRTPGTDVRAGGDPSYALQLLLTSCKLDPTNVEHRRKLREVGRSAGRRSGWLGSLANRAACLMLWSW